ncbi:MAG: DNA gyrase inhibitor YacG [Thermodesulfobacteriota bacterium]
MTLKVKCPKCEKEVLWHENKWRPFCSERCKMIDLGTWAKEDYRISQDSDRVTISSNDLDDEDLF